MHFFSNALLRSFSERTRALLKHEREKEVSDQEQLKGNDVQADLILYWVELGDRCGISKVQYLSSFR